ARKRGNDRGMRTGDEQATARRRVLSGSFLHPKRETAKDSFQQTTQPPGNPGRVDLELYDQQAVEPEQSLGPGKGFQRIDVVVDPYVCVAGACRVGVEERKDDEVELLFAVFDIAPRVVKDRPDPSRVIGFFEMQPSAQIEYQRIDLDGNHAPGAVADGR